MPGFVWDRLDLDGNTSWHPQRSQASKSKAAQQRGGRLAARTEQSCFYYMMNRSMAAPACRRGAREGAVRMILVVYTWLGRHHNSGINLSGRDTKDHLTGLCSSARCSLCESGRARYDG